MHAILCREHGGPDVMQYTEIDQPRPAAGEVVIESEAIGVNYVDTMRRSGRHPSAPKPPFTPGIEVCGRVVAVGDDVTKFQPGDRVIGRCVSHGAYAEFVCVEERFTVACPEAIDSEQGAALFVTGQTALHALQTIGQVQPKETVLITAAAGGVGTCAVQIAKLLGAQVIAAAGSNEKCQLARDNGADAAINYSRSGWPEQVRDATAGRGVDLIIESVGGEIAAASIACWAPGGRMVIFGKASGQAATISGDDLLFGNRTVHGLAVGAVIENEPVMRHAMDQLTAWLNEGQLHLHIGQTYPLQHAPEAHRDLEARHTTGKLVLKP
ncbi:MAG: NADPH:quinone oxidoreductase family protein [Planctomycetota bacterium]|nr:MAG: NADPH:quinone oxidoreductase family protein [Planctomycetota bacterium]REJ90143.1 MAG: NADPH:quinone oxidoreductase family protein [Planctomycetota bacterium]REK30711.1 MAG: NADPH:quinone oxidoreductase family protein [Planctomycetota bacterium]REK33086.1 MAG: NADPH:quinone oxidoreductase family protein [Planctomycetota bacterium]